MRTFVVVSFLLMGGAFWIMSGGSSFVPEARPEAAPAAVAAITRADASLDDLPLAAAPPAGAQAPPAPVSAPVPAEPLAPAAALLALAPEMAAPLAPPPEAPVLADEPAPAPDLRVVTADAVNLREGPGTDFAVVGRLTRGERAEVIEAADGWARVRSTGGEAWVAERFLGPGA